MSRLWILTILCSAILSAPAAAQERNLVLKRPYDYHPNPRYSDTKDEGDIRQLTDGKTFPSSSLWMQKSTVGWAAGIDVPVVIWFDLGREATVTELRFHTASGLDAGVIGERGAKRDDEIAFIHEPARDRRARAPQNTACIGMIVRDLTLGFEGGEHWRL